MTDVYILQSLKNRRIYVGVSENVEKRLDYHNSRLSPSTKKDAPFKLMAVESFTNLQQARRREHFLKSHQGRDVLQRKFGPVKKKPGPAKSSSLMS